jgi:hypothetical protein
VVIVILARNHDFILYAILQSVRILVNRPRMFAIEGIDFSKDGARDAGHP